jgi:hypothetical protein
MVAGTEKEGCVLQVLGLHLMAEVEDRGLRVDGEDDALHHPHVGINAAKVGSQDYGRSGSHIASGGQASRGLGEPNAKNGDQQENGDQHDGELEQCPLHPSSGTQGILGGAEQSAATFPYLHQDEQHQYN